LRCCCCVCLLAVCSLFCSAIVIITFLTIILAMDISSCCLHSIGVFSCSYCTLFHCWCRCFGYSSVRCQCMPLLSSPTMLFLSLSLVSYLHPLPYVIGVGASVYQCFDRWVTLEIQSASSGLVPSCQPLPTTGHRCSLRIVAEDASPCLYLYSWS
jgi:hypothetical protein